MKIQQTITNNIGIEDLETPGYQHHDGLHFEDYKHNSYKKLAEGITNIFPYISGILEIGSGAGSLAFWIKQIRKDVVIVTLDGNKEIVNSPYIDKDNHFIVRTDEDYQLEYIKTIVIFDLILSYEHLEHIQEQKLEKWFENVNKHSKKGTIFLGTASTLDYNRRVHVTLNDKVWWISCFEKYGWKYMADLHILNSENKPFNFETDRTNELIFEKL